MRHWAIAPNFAGVESWFVLLAESQDAISSVPTFSGRGGAPDWRKEPIPCTRLVTIQTSHAAYPVFPTRLQGALRTTGKLIFTQAVAHLLPISTVRRCLARYNGEHKVKRFSCLDQYLCVAFVQMIHPANRRDIEACLRSLAAKLRYMRFHSIVARNTLANAHAVHDWRIHADFARSLISIATRSNVGEPFGVDPVNTAHVSDPTTIDP